MNNVTRLRLTQCSRPISHVCKVLTWSHDSMRQAYYDGKLTGSEECNKYEYVVAGNNESFIVRTELNSDVAIYGIIFVNYTMQILVSNGCASTCYICISNWIRKIMLNSTQNRFKLSSIPCSNATASQFLFEILENYSLFYQ